MKFPRILALAVLVFASAFAAQAQEVIMNQPSADVVSKGSLFVRSDSFYTQSNVAGAEHLWGTANFSYGVGHNCEVSVNGSDIYHGADTWQVIPGFKCDLINNQNFALYVGDQYWKPVGNVMGFHNGNVSYEAAAFKYKGWRFTGGTFQSHNAYQLGNRAGAIGGVETPMVKLTKTWMLSAGVDYASGSGINGYTSPGIMFSKGNFFISPGYMIANPHNPNGAHQTFVMIGYTFARKP